MIRTETYMLGGREFVRTWSDTNRYVVGGEPYGKYTEAHDPSEFGRVYTEGELIPPGDDDIDDAEALSILLGGVGE